MRVSRAEGGDVVLPMFDGTMGDNVRREWLGRDVLLGLRPEAIADPREAEAHTSHHHQIEARVEVTEPTGPDILAVIRLGGAEATARLRADSRVNPGERASFMVDMSKAVLFDPASENRIYT